ncbi:hypothetical protein M0802_000984 [Mischocyttarus mexicanus]|nr:hypothetical protein M0802_000984 [Mischocyttarus mexicanus]
MMAPADSATLLHDGWLAGWLAGYALRPINTMTTPHQRARILCELPPATPLTHPIHHQRCHLWTPLML